MKRAIIASVFIVTLLASAAVGISVTETGISVLLSVGDEKRPIEALIVFTDQSGAVLSPSGGVLTVPEGEPVNVQVFPKAPGGEKSFIVGYTTETLMPKEPKRATFDPKFGWYFQLTPEETAQPANWARALQIAVTNRDGRKSWVRVIFKITYGSGWLTQYDQIVIKTVPRSQMAIAGGAGSSGTDASDAVEALKTNQAKTADYVSQLEKRVSELESWAREVGGEGVVSSSGGIPTPTSSSAGTVTLPVYFTGNFASLGLRVTAPDGVATGYVVKTTGISLPLEKGNNRFDMLVDDGRGNLRKLSCTVAISQATKSVTVDLEGGRK